jgi:hypothetical protein
MKQDCNVVAISATELRNKLMWVQKKVGNGCRFVVTRNGLLYFLLTNIDVMESLLLDGRVTEIGTKDFRAMLTMVVDEFENGIEATYILNRGRRVMVCLPPRRVSEVVPGLKMLQGSQAYMMEDVG